MNARGNTRSPVQFPLKRLPRARAENVPTLILLLSTAQFMLDGNSQLSWDECHAC